MGRLPAAAFTAALCAAFAAQAAEMVVVDAQGVELKPGQVVAGERPLVLLAGQRVSLVTQSGRIVQLTGPSEAAPEAAPKADDRSVLNALKDMIQTKQAKTASLGVTRSGRTALPSPWLVDVSSSGAVCVLEGKPVVLWRPDAERDLPLTITSGEVKARATWPAGAQRLEGPAQLTPADGQVMVLNAGAAKAEMVFTLVPAAMKSDEARLAWLVEKDCLTQAVALARELE